MTKPEGDSFVCPHVIRDGQPVLYVCRSEGDWQFLCGGMHGENELPEIVEQAELVKRDPTLEKVMNIPDGWEAERKSVGDTWFIHPAA